MIVGEQGRERSQEDKTRRDLQARLRRLQRLQEEIEQRQAGEEAEDEEPESTEEDEAEDAVVDEDEDGDHDEADDDQDGVEVLENDDDESEDNEESEDDEEKDEQPEVADGGKMNMKEILGLLKSTVDLARSSMNGGMETWSADAEMSRGDRMMKSLAEEKVFGIQRYVYEANKAVIYNKGKQGIKYAFDPTSESMMLYIVKHSIDLRIGKIPKKKRKGDVWKLLIDVRNVLDMISAAQIWCDRNLVTTKIFRMWEADPRCDKSMEDMLGDLGMVPMIMQAHSMVENDVFNKGDRNNYNVNHGTNGGHGDGYGGGSFEVDAFGGGPFGGDSFGGGSFGDYSFGGDSFGGDHFDDGNHNFMGGRGVCWNFQRQGSCAYGNACKFKHVMREKGDIDDKHQAAKEEDEKEG